MKKQFESETDALKIGSVVWIYEDGYTPRVGKITKYGLTDIPDTWYVRDQYGERLYTEHRIFTDPVKLVSAVEDTVNMLSRWLRENDEIDAILEKLESKEEA